MKVATISVLLLAILAGGYFVGVMYGPHLDDDGAENEKSAGEFFGNGSGDGAGSGGAGTGSGSGTGGTGQAGQDGQAGQAGIEGDASAAEFIDEYTGDNDSLNAALERSRRTAITNAVERASPAVVGINVTEVREYRAWNPWGDDPFFRFYGGQTYKKEVKGLGSGFIIAPSGYILTNDHVAGNAKEITVTLTTGETYPAKLVGTDLVSDIALLKIEGESFPYLRLGNSDNVLIGEWVIAIGNPFGLFEISEKPTVTVGVVSATGMNIDAQNERYYRNMIQTDAAINSGNSGGPLLNALGQVIGINAVIYTPNQGNIGLGFAIPINRVKMIAEELKAKGKIERNFWTGLRAQSVDRRVARYFGLEKIEGVIISEVVAGSPGATANLKPGDIILEVDGETLRNEDHLVAILSDKRPGDALKLKILREKRTLNVTLTLEVRPA